MIRFFTNVQKLRYIGTSKETSQQKLTGLFVVLQSLLTTEEQVKRAKNGT